jgi:branched-chain amino acid aminotransferase
MRKFVNINGKIMAPDAPQIQADNRGYLYGDGCFETIKVIRGKAVNLENHIARILAGAHTLKLRAPNYFDLDYFQKQIDELIAYSKEFQGGKIRLSFERSAGGTYIPDTNEVSFTIEYLPDNSNGFILNDHGLELDLYSEHKKSINKLSPLKTKNGLLYVLAAVQAKEQGLDDMLVMNEKMAIIESSSCNLFVVSNGVLYTPSLDDGILAGTMRMQIINIALQNGIKVYECTIMPHNILSADEILLTNAIAGIKWVGGYRTKRYRNDMARRLMGLLNEKYER